MVENIGFLYRFIWQWLQEIDEKKNHWTKKGIAE